MRIINVIESQGGSTNHVTSFCIHEDQLSQDVIKDAENFFMDTIHSKTGIDKEDMEAFVEDGFYEDKDSGYLIEIGWSDVVN